MVNDKTAQDDPRPVSAVSSGVGLSGLVGLAFWIIVARNFGTIAAYFGFDAPALADGPYSALIAVFCTGLPMVLWSVFVDKVHLRESTGMDWKNPKPVKETFDTSLTKLTGLWATWAIIAFLYCVCRWYWDDLYLFSMDIMMFAAPILFAVSIPYVIFLDRFMVEPRDGAFAFGQLFIGNGKPEKETIYNHLRSWTVKGFFLAFMISIVPGGFGDIVRVDISEVVTNPVWIAHWLIIAMFVVDVQLATVGYLLTMKPLDSHIRTANPYMSGWVAALICYPPFALMYPGGPLDYHVNTKDWAYWFADYPTLLMFWGGILVFLTAIYAWATVAFGLRFSNLTHRGILTHGPYRWTKHPAYVAKNTYWWLATMPFVVTSGSYVDMIRNFVLIAAVSAVYFWRAKTEEKHLMSDPAYQEYAAWMERNAPLPKLVNWITGKRSKARLEAEVQPAE